MEKIIFDAFDVDTACFEAPPKVATQVDNCKISVSYHNREDINAAQAPLSFSREKSDFVYTPGQSSIPVLKSLGFNEKSPLIQSALHFEVIVQANIKDQYPKFAAARSYKGPNLTPLSLKMLHFTTTGDIEKPDAIQLKAMSVSLKELLATPKEAKEWFNTFFSYLVDPKHNQKNTPANMQPRIQWFLDQLKNFEALQEIPASVKGNSPEINSLRSSISQTSIHLLDHLSTGLSSFDDLKKELDVIAKQLYALEPSESSHDLFLALSQKLENISQQTLFSQNSEAKGRLLKVQGYLKQAVADHRAELLNLSPSEAFQKSLEYRLNDAANKGLLDNRVKLEASDANLPSSWIKQHSKELIQTVIPHIQLNTNTGSAPRVQINIDAIKKSTEQLIEKHSVQVREFHIGVLAVLRYLMGNQLTDTKMTGWTGDDFQELEIENKAGDREKMIQFRSELGGKIDSSLKNTNLYLPLAETSLLAIGGGLTVLQLSKNDWGRSKSTVGALGVSSAAAVGSAGLAGLSCHYLVKTRNQYISDGICAGVGLLVGGFTSYYLVRPLGSSSGGPGSQYIPPIDSRGPNTPYGP
ncbi:MAG: hypothetical protein JNK65_09315 [Deltaproteobacteria bacterium]|nr:hypothetical protein [Deltaproteobacteria bacterium]